MPIFAHDALETERIRGDTISHVVDSPFAILPAEL
jgi:hypothetical protein